MPTKQADKSAHGARYEERDKKRAANMLKKKDATVAAVAKELEIPRRTLRRWAKRYGVECPGNRRVYDHKLIKRELRKKDMTLDGVAAKAGCSVRLVRAVRNGEA